MPTCASCSSPPWSGTGTRSLPLDRGSAVTEAHCRWAHCILLDVMMPGEVGFATCQRVRALADCPILFLTAKTEEADVIQGLGLGGDDYLTKPFRLGSSGPGSRPPAPAAPYPPAPVPPGRPGF